MVVVDVYHRLDRRAQSESGEHVPDDRPGVGLRRVQHRAEHANPDRRELGDARRQQLDLDPTRVRVGRRRGPDRVDVAAPLQRRLRRLSQRSRDRAERTPPQPFSGTRRPRPAAVWPSRSSTSISTSARYLGLLRDGVNVLAVQGLNDSAADANFLLEAELLGVGFARRESVLPRADARRAQLRGLVATDLLPQFSQTTGVYYAPFQLTLTTTLPGGVIRYTLDQTDPTEASPTYTGPITISKSTRIRAAVFVPGQPTSLVASESYFVLDPALQSFDSNLGLVVIDTFGQSINQNDYATVSTAFFDASGGNRASLSDTPDYTSLAGLRLRGTYSLWLNDYQTGLPGDVRMGEKPSYRLELRDELGDDLAASLLGLPEDSDWVLYSLYDDKTLMRDYLSYQWFNEMGDWAPSGRYIELYVNQDGDEVTAEDYVGLYIVFQKIAVGKDLVDIEKLDPEDNAPPDVTGGYIIKKDRLEPGEKALTTSHGYQFVLLRSERKRSHRGATGLSSRLHERVRVGPVRDELRRPGQRLCQIHRRRLVHRHAHHAGVVQKLGRVQVQFVLLQGPQRQARGGPALGHEHHVRDCLLRLGPGLVPLQSRGLALLADLLERLQLPVLPETLPGPRVRAEVHRPPQRTPEHHVHGRQDDGGHGRLGDLSRRGASSGTSRGGTISWASTSGRKRGGARPTKKN